MSILTGIKAIPPKKLMLAAFLSLILVGISLYSFIVLKDFSSTLITIKKHNAAVSHLYSLRNYVDELNDLSATATYSGISLQQKNSKIQHLRDVSSADLDSIVALNLPVFDDKVQLSRIMTNITKIADINGVGGAQNGDYRDYSAESLLIETVYKDIDSLYSKHVVNVDTLTEKYSEELKSLYLSVSLNFMIIGIFIALYYIKSAKESQSLQELSKSLSRAVHKSDSTVLSLSILSELSVFLQAAPDLTLAKEVSKEYGFKLFSDYSGGYYSLIDAEENKLGLMFQWGAYSYGSVIHLDECWGISSKTTHVVQPGSASAVLRCAHIPSDSSYICVPVEVRGKIEGLFILKANGVENFDSAFVKLVETYANHICLGISNIGLRDNLKDLAIKDPLTGLYNRRYMEETLIRYIRDSQRESSSIAVLIVDIDYFKRINDTFGHDAGDYVLKELADLMTALVRAKDIVCRFGGEEFVIVLHNVEFDDAIIKAESIRSVVESRFLQHNSRIISPITASIGVSCYNPQEATAVTPDSLIKAADTALYEAKHNGRNRVVIAH